MSRTIDPEALREFARTIEPELDKARHDLAPMLEPDQPLGKMPAFGVLDNADNARSDYGQFHEAMWDHAQKLIENLEGLHQALTESAGDADASDEAGAADIQAQGRG